MVKETSRVLKPDGIIVISTPTPNFGGCVFDLTHINVRPPSFWKLKFEERNLRMKSLYISPFNKYCMKNYFPIPDSIELLLEELFRYNNILGCYYVRKKARLCFVVNKPRHISGD